MVPSKMNGEPYQAGKMAHALRTDLFKEHLGLLPHVEHDVVTKASVLPVDLDAPHKDPEQARLELIRKANRPEEIERQKRQMEFQQQQFAMTQGLRSGSAQPVLQVPAEIQPHLAQDHGPSGSSSQGDALGLLTPSQESHHHCSSRASSSSVSQPPTPPRKRRPRARVRARRRRSQGL